MSTATTTDAPPRRRAGPRQPTRAERIAARTRRYRKSTFLLGILSFLVPLAMAHQIEIVGRLYAAEALLLLILPLLLIDRGPMLLDPLPRMILTLGAIWLGSQIVTDLVVGSTYDHYSRGWSKIVFFLGNFAAIYMLVYGNRSRMILFGLGLGIGLAVTTYRYPTPISIVDPWKFGVSLAVSLCVLVMTHNKMMQRAAIIPISVLLILGAFNMYMGSRAAAGMLFLTAMYLVAQIIFGKKGDKVTPPTYTRLAFLAIVGAGAAWLVLELYSYAALEGMLGDDAKEKYLGQVSMGAGILLGGRHEVLVSLQAIADSPILGHGSWAEDRKYIDLLMAMTRSEGQEIEASYFGALIPTHSYLTGAWVEAGMLGGLFWIFIMFQLVKVLGNLFQIRDPMSPLVVFVCLTLMWDILFSPFGADRRVVVAYEIVLVVFVWEVLRATAERAKQIRRIRKAARHALGKRGGLAPAGPRGPARPLPNARLMRRPPPNVTRLPRPSERAAALRRQAQARDDSPQGNDEN